MTIPKIYVVIVTYNGMKWIDKCLSSLRTSIIPISIIVIDNLSTDNTAAFVKDNYPETIIIKNQFNAGFGQANNIGIKYSIENDAEYVFLLNQDAWIFNDTIKKLLDVSDMTSVLSPIHLDGKSKKLDYNFKSCIINSIQGNELLEDMLINKKLDESYISNFINAACWLIPISIIKKIGGFNPLFYHYGEDLNYYHRIMYHKLNLKVVTSAYICHDREQFGNKKLFNSKLLYRELLLNFSNINEPLISLNKPRLKLHLSSIYNIVLSIFKLDYKKAYLIFTSYTSALSKIHHIYSNRKKEKSIGPSWL